ncbi:hypothetical protein KNE206_35430 [Kitasatospora sp. NE20-6]
MRLRLWVEREGGGRVYGALPAWLRQQGPVGRVGRWPMTAACPSGVCQARGSGRPGCSPPRAWVYVTVGTITLRRKMQTTVPSCL